MVNIYSFKSKSGWIGGGGVGGDGDGGALVGDEIQNLLLSAELLKWIYLRKDFFWKKLTTPSVSALTALESPCYVKQN